MQFGKFAVMDYLPNIPIVTGEIADYQLDSDGILYAYSKSILRTVNNISNPTEAKVWLQQFV